MLEVKDKALRQKKVIFWQWHIVDIQWQQAQLWFCEPAPPPPRTSTVENNLNTSLQISDVSTPIHIYLVAKLL